MKATHLGVVLVLRYCLCAEAGQLLKLAWIMEIMLRPFLPLVIFERLWKWPFTYCGLTRFASHIFAQLLAWRLFFWFSLTQRQRSLIRKHFHKMPSLTWTLALHSFLLFSQENPLRWKKTHTHANAHAHGRTNTRTNTPGPKKGKDLIMSRCAKENWDAQLDTRILLIFPLFCWKKEW